MAGLSLPRTAYGIRTFVWHADFIDTYLRGALERGAAPAGRVGVAPERAVDVVVEPLWAWVRTIGAGCDATFAASRFQADKLRAHGVARVELLPFGVDKAIFHPGRRDEARRRARLGSREGPLVVAIGRFAVEKRWDVLREVYERLAAKAPGAKLVLFGDGPERPALEAWAAARGDVELAGFVKGREELAAELASADLLLHTCPYETFGLGVAEALATGLPAVLPDLGGAAELADGVSALATRSLDAGAAAASALTLLARGDAARRDAVRAASRIPSEADHFRALLGRYEALLAARPAR